MHSNFCILVCAQAYVTPDHLTSGKHLARRPLGFKVNPAYERHMQIEWGMLPQDPPGLAPMAVGNGGPPFGGGTTAAAPPSEGRGGAGSTTAAAPPFEGRGGAGGTMAAAPPSEGGGAGSTTAAAPQPQEIMDRMKALEERMAVMEHRVDRWMVALHETGGPAPPSSGTSPAPPIDGTSSALPSSGSDDSFRLVMNLDC